MILIILSGLGDDQILLLISSVVSDEIGFYTCQAVVEQLHYVLLRRIER